VHLHLRFRLTTFSETVAWTVTLCYPRTQLIWFQDNKLELYLFYCIFYRTTIPVILSYIQMWSTISIKVTHLGLGFNDITYKFIIHVYTMDMYLNVKEHKIDKKKNLKGLLIIWKSYIKLSTFKVILKIYFSVKLSEFVWNFLLLFLFLHFIFFCSHVFAAI
jgi:hypothetical protein